MGHPVTWFQIQGRNGEALVEFYTKVFGWKTTPNEGSPGVQVSPDEGGIPGVVGPLMGEGERSVAVYINCSDIDGHLLRIQEAGGQAAMPKMELPGDMGFIAGFIDVSGNWIGLYQPSEKMKAMEAAKKATKKKPAKKKAAKKKAAKKKPAKKKAAKKKPAAKKKAAKKKAAKKKPAKKKAAKKKAAKKKPKAAKKKAAKKRRGKKKR